MKAHPTQKHSESKKICHDGTKILDNIYEISVFILIWNCVKLHKVDDNHKSYGHYTYKNHIVAAPHVGKIPSSFVRLLWVDMRVSSNLFAQSVQEMRFMWNWPEPQECRSKKKHKIPGPSNYVPMFIEYGMKVFEEMMKNVLSRTFKMERDNIFG